MGKSKSGFTIVELLIVIVVIAILAAITIVAFNGVRARAITSEQATKFQTVVKLLANFKTLNGYYPCGGDIAGTAGAQLLETTTDTFEYGSTNPKGGGYGGPGSIFSYSTWPNPDGSGFGQSTGQCQSYVLQYAPASGGATVLNRNPEHRGY